MADDPALRVARSVDEVLALFERHGHDHYDESISQLDHALQTAALGHVEGASDELVAAALLHDVGHLLELDAGGRAPTGDAPDAPDLHHEASGARYLAGLFGPAVTAPIALHVRAKRYLCAVDASYASSLSAGSTTSLARQGGPLSTADAVAFEQNPGWQDAVRLRRWDDGGKVEGLALVPIRSYEPMLDRLAAKP